MFARKTNFVTRRARVEGAGVNFRQWSYLMRQALITASIFIILIFSLNLIVKYFFESYNVKKAVLKISPFAEPRFLILKDNYYVLYSNGRTKFVDNNIDKTSMPVLTGIKIDEKREKYKKLRKQVLSIDKKYFANISEINVKNPENIIMITIDGKKVLAGNSLSEDKIKNLFIAIKNINKRYDYVDIRYKDRVIIK